MFGQARYHIDRYEKCDIDRLQPLGRAPFGSQNFDKSSDLFLLATGRARTCSQTRLFIKGGSGTQMSALYFCAQVRTAVNTEKH